MSYGNNPDSPIYEDEKLTIYREDSPLLNEVDDRGFFEKVKNFL